MAQPTISNNLLQAFEVVNSPYKQAHRSIDCCNLYCEYPMPTPQGKLPHFQFRTLDTISAIEVYDLSDQLVDTININVLTVNTIDNINYYSYMGANIGELACGKYYLKLVGAVSSYFTQLFVVTTICCMSQLLWWNDCNTSTVIYENGYTNQIWLRALGDPRFESVSVTETTEQEGRIFREYAALEDYFVVEVGPVYNYLVRVLQSVTLHENIVYIDRNGEYAKVMSMAVEEINSVGGRCLYKVKLKLRQKNPYDTNFCCDDIDDSTAQGLPTPDDVGCGNADPCLPPTISSVSLGPGSAVVTWVGVPFATDYEVSVNGGSFQSAGNTNSITLSDLDACTAYTVCIRTECAENTSAVACTTFQTSAVPCGDCPEENFFVTSVTATGISIAFDGSGAATGYQIEWKTIGESWATALSDTITGTSGTNNYSISNLQPCTAYHVRFRPLCEGNSCNQVGCWTMITASTQCCDSLIDYDITITQGNCFNPNSAVQVAVTIFDTSYTITILQNNVPVATATNATLNTSLPPGNYIIVVQDARCTSTPYAFAIANPCPCVAPGIINAFPQNQQATLDWTDVLGATSYELQWRAVTSTTWNNVTGIAPSAYTLTMLNTCTVYEWRVRSECGGQYSDWSVIHVFQTTGCQQQNCQPNEAIEIQCVSDGDGFCFTASDAGTYLETPVTNVIQFSMDMGQTWNTTLPCLVGVGGIGFGGIFTLEELPLFLFPGINITITQVGNVFTATGSFVSPISAPDVASIQSVWDNSDGNIFTLTTSTCIFYTIKGQAGNSFSISTSGFTISFNDNSSLYGAGLQVLALILGGNWDTIISILGTSFFQAELNQVESMTTQFLIRHVLTFPSCPPVNVVYAVYDILTCSCYNLLNTSTNVQTTVGECCFVEFLTGAECNPDGTATITITPIAPFSTTLNVYFDDVFIIAIPANSTYIANPITATGQTITIKITDADDEDCFMEHELELPDCPILCEDPCEVAIVGYEFGGLDLCDSYRYFETFDAIPEAATIQSITIQGNTYTPPAPIAYSNTTALLAWLNSLPVLARFYAPTFTPGPTQVLYLFAPCGFDVFDAYLTYTNGGGPIDKNFFEGDDSIILTCEQIQTDYLPDFDCLTACNEAQTVDVTVYFEASCGTSGSAVTITITDGADFTLASSPPADAGFIVFYNVPANGATYTIRITDFLEEQPDCEDEITIVVPDCTPPEPDFNLRIGGMAFGSAGALETYLQVLNPTATVTNYNDNGDGTEDFLVAGITGLAAHTFNANTYAAANSLTVFIDLTDFITDLGAYCFHQCSAAETYVLNGAITIGNHCFSFNGTPNPQSFSLNSAQSIGDYCFLNAGNLTSLSLPAVLNLGTTVGNDGVFQNTAITALTVPISLATVNAGNPDGDITQLITDNSATITYL